jgi:hypothetical protein
MPRSCSSDDTAQAGVGAGRVPARAPRRLGPPRSAPAAAARGEEAPRAAARGARPAAPAGAPLPRAWRVFTRALAGVLAALEDGQCLILARRQGGGYVQVAAEEGGGLRVEAVSNHYLEGSARLDRARTGRLRRLGWLPPTHAPGKKRLSRRERTGSPNFYRDLACEIDYAATAGLLVATLREVYGARSPGRLAYTAFADGRGDILLPTLGIEREKSGAAAAARPAPRQPGNAGELEGLVVGALKAWTGKDDWAFDGDGNLVLSRDGVGVLLRVARTLPFVDMFSTVLRDVEPSLELLEALNERNNDGRCVVLTVMGSRVVASLSVDASTFVPELLARAFAAVADTVEAARTELQRRFGGRAGLEDEPAQRPAAGPSAVN